jgi:hypothetical protein
MNVLRNTLGTRLKRLQNLMKTHWEQTEKIKQSKVLATSFDTYR